MQFFSVISVGKSYVGKKSVDKIPPLVNSPLVKSPLITNLLVKSVGKKSVGEKFGNNVYVAKRSDGKQLSERKYRIPKDKHAFFFAVRRKSLLKM